MIAELIGWCFVVMMVSFTWVFVTLMIEVHKYIKGRFDYEQETIQK